jgi:hypothetical protein
MPLGLALLSLTGLSGCATSSSTEPSIGVVLLHAGFFGPVGAALKEEEDAQEVKEVRERPASTHEEGEQSREAHEQAIVAAVNESEGEGESAVESAGESGPQATTEPAEVPASEGATGQTQDPGEAAAESVSEGA